jgi:pimeloyl-ACP methyl ester carboxylesterase
MGSAAGPTVVFEAGISGSSLSWANVQPLVAEFANAVAYDRAGLGWSAGALTPRTVAHMVGELAAGLEVLGVSRPYLLVGHSFGGLLVQTFAHTYPERTAGVVMVDPVTQAGWVSASPEQLGRIRMGARLSRRGAVLAQIGIVRMALLLLMSGGKGAAQTVSRASSGKANSLIERLVGEVQKLPKKLHPVVAAHWSRARAFKAMAAHLECLPATARTAVTMPVPRNIPLAILSAETATAEEVAEREEWVSANQFGRHIQVARCGHWLQLDRPDLVADVVREMLTRVR